MLASIYVNKKKSPRALNSIFEKKKFWVIWSNQICIEEEKTSSTQYKSLHSIRVYRKRNELLFFMLVLNFIYCVDEDLTCYLR